MKSEEYIQLYEKYLSGKCTPEEERRLFEYKDGFRMHEVDMIQQDKALRRQIYNKIKKNIRKEKTFVIRQWIRYAAAILLIVSVGVVIYKVNIPQEQRPLEEIVFKPVVKPSIDSSSVTLILSNGEVVSLEDVDKGLLSEDDYMKITKTQDGEVLYKYGENLPSDYTLSFNTLYVPKGRQYKLTLADGTAVWLNANSTLHYPIRFTGAERLVELSGEGYFEVSKNDTMPFVVKTKKAKVQVLGTHFNIAAYADDDVEKTTLVEGAVKIYNNDKSVILEPGQQGIIKEGKVGVQVVEADMRQVLSWSDGLFIFKDDYVEDVMKQIARWYDVDIIYEKGKLEGKVFGGIYAKSKSLEELLKGLELTGNVKFKIEGKRVIVMD